MNILDGLGNLFLERSCPFGEKFHSMKFWMRAKLHQSSQLCIWLVNATSILSLKRVENLRCSGSRDQPHNAFMPSPEEERSKPSKIKNATALILITGFRVYSKRPKKRNTGDFDLTKEDILSRIQSGFCEATGMPFDLSVKGPFSPSLDQVVPSKGYTKDNIRVVCLIYNLMKSNFDERDVDRFIGQLRFNSDETWLP